MPRCGGITLSALTVGRCDRILQAAFLEQSLSAVRRIRPMLGLVCSYSMRDDAIPFNPVRDVQRLPLPEKKTTVLTPPQIASIRELMGRWREDSGMGPRPNYRALIDGMDITHGASARVGECIGLRRRDVDMTTNLPTPLIGGRITQTRELGVRRKNAPKRTRQRRGIALPSMAAAAVRCRRVLAVRGAEPLLFPTVTGSPMSVSNGERLLRSWVDDNRDALTALGVDPGRYSTQCPGTRSRGPRADENRSTTSRSRSLMTSIGTTTDDSTARSDRSRPPSSRAPIGRTPRPRLTV